MQVDEFAQEVSSFFAAYYAGLLCGRKLIGVKGAALPTTLLIAESPAHYIAELLGAQPQCSPEKFRLTSTAPQKVPTTDAFLNPYTGPQGGQPTTFACQGEGSLFLSRLTFLDATATMDGIRRAFPFSLRATSIRSGQAHGRALSANDNRTNLFIYGVDVLCGQGDIVAYRTINAACVVPKGVSREALQSSLPGFVQQVEEQTGGPLLAPFPSRAREFARQLLAMTTIPITEPAIDAFVKTHADWFAQALGYAAAEPQCVLERQCQQAAGEASALRPDYLMRRSDGYYDILDLKKALLASSVTVGPADRKQFSHYVDDLIAQLSTYRDYFAEPTNAEWAMSRYGIRVHNPKLIGIVGNYGSFDRSAVDRALRIFDPMLALLSYSEVIQMLCRIG